MQQIMERSLSTQKAEELADHHMEVEEKKNKKRDDMEREKECDARSLLHMHNASSTWVGEVACKPAFAGWCVYGPVWSGV